MGVRCRRLLAVSALALTGAILFAPPAGAKRSPAQELDLRIVQVTLSPDVFVPGREPLAMAIEVELPPHLDGQTLLEVSSLISSPSMRSMRFLFSRQPVVLASNASMPRVTVTLTWDGTDQEDRIVGPGRYAYEVRAKLLTVRENGPRTLMQSWPKRGVIEIK